MKKDSKRRPAGMIAAALGVLLILLTVVQAGSSFFSPRTISSSADVELVGANGGGTYRPFNRAVFVYSTFSGLYLSDDYGKVQVWVMWGVLDDGWVCFYLPADGKDTNGDGVFDENDAPADQWNVEFILRAARPNYHEHSAWVLDESISESAAYYGTTTGEMSTFFADSVLEAGRAGLFWARTAFAAGVLLALAGGALLLLPENVRLIPKRLRRADSDVPDGEDEWDNDPDADSAPDDRDESDDLDDFDESDTENLDGGSDSTDADGDPDDLDDRPDK